MSFKSRFSFLILFAIPLIFYSQALPKLIPYRHEDKWGYVDHTGKFVIQPKYKTAEPFSEGYGLVSVPFGYTDIDHRFIDETGKEFFQTDYRISLSFSEGFASIFKVVKQGESSKYGAIDKSFKVIIEPIYDWRFEFRDGIAIVRLNNKYGFIDKTGKQIIAPKYDREFEFKDGLARVELNDKYGYIDKTGKEVIPLKYGYADDFFVDQIAAVEINDKWGYIDKSGKVVIDFKYYNVQNVSDGFICFQLVENGKWGVMDSKGKEIYPVEYALASSIGERMLYLKKDGQDAEIIKNGKKIASVKYDRIFTFSEGLAKVIQDGKCGYIDRNFKEIVKPKYDLSSGSFKDGFAKVVFKRGYGIINKTGKEIVPPILDFIWDFENGLANVSFYRLSKYGDAVSSRGYIDITGKMYWDKSEEIVVRTLLFRLGGKPRLESFVNLFMKKLSESGDRQIISLNARIKAANTDSIAKKIIEALCVITDGDCSGPKIVKKISISTRQWDTAKQLFLDALAELKVGKYESGDLNSAIDKAKDNYFVIEETSVRGDRRN